MGVLIFCTDLYVNSLLLIWLTESLASRLPWLFVLTILRNSPTPTLVAHTQSYQRVSEMLALVHARPMYGTAEGVHTAASSEAHRIGK